MNDLGFLREVEKATGENISACYQCYRCTAGCPVAADMDIYPHRIIRHIILGDRDRALGSKMIWTCLQCTTCSVRCPNDIDVARVFDALRKISAWEGKMAEKDVWRFDEIFLESVQRHGRLNELEAILRYKIGKKDLFGDTVMGMGMLKKGRMGLLPHNIKDRNGMKGIFKKIDDKKVRG
ncbi:MAG: 4Fe-4S dicluster domain-containing protein [Syntrophorhabdaceae bacterium]|nr:4Fe-4S dicluster domain-containing protein [Syntrophorhabdaceae bacterium]